MGLVNVKIRGDSSILTDAVAEQLRKQDDPLDSSKPARKLSVKKVYSVGEPDKRGLSEILYVDQGDNPLTALVRGRSREVVSLEEGW